MGSMTDQKQHQQDRLSTNLAKRQMLGLYRSARSFGKDIKLAHSVFALPFGAAAFFVADLSVPSLMEIYLLMICMVAARTFAMGANRYLDRHIDKLNPRTRNRMIPSSEMQPVETLGWSVLAALVFIVGAFGLNPTAGWCSFPLLGILGFYSWLKRLGWLTHFYLGMCLGLAPIAVVVGLKSTVEWPVILLALAVMFWTAGFDIIYALQDREFDKDYRLKSVPATFGPRVSIDLSRLLFGLMIVVLSLIGILINSGLLYFFGVSLIAALLIFEHWLVRDARHTGKSAGITAAFFNVNACVSLIYLGALIGDYLFGATLGAG